MNNPAVSKPSPWDRVNIFSKIFFTWVWPLYIKGHKRDLEFQDLYQCPKNDEANQVCDKLEKQWIIELQKKKPYFARAVFKAFIGEFIPLFFVFLFQECVVRLSQPILLGIVVSYFEKKKNIDHQDAVLAAIGIVACSAVFITINHITIARALRVGFRMRVACCTLMYRKSIKLSKSAMAQTAVGQIVNIMSNDVNRFDEVSLVMHSPIVSVLQSALIMFMLWEHLEWACLTGIAVLILFVPFQGVMGRLFQAVRRKTAVLTDNRIRVMSEIITGMRVIKMYTWEKPFALLVNECRKREIHRIKQASFLKAVNLAIYFMSSKIILFACFVTYVYQNKTLYPEAIFVSMAYFNTMRITVTKNFPNSIAALAETAVTCKRIETFLMHEEVQKKPTENKLEANENGVNDHKSDKGVFIRNATARWNQDIPIPTFSSINAFVKPGELLAIIGPVGSGKSSLLMSLLNELPLESGKIDINGKMSYASQEAWAFVATVKENILFGSEYDEQRYKEVIRVCALERDMEQFPHGDQTIVGERGVSLSGGQKTRITLARALYNEADIYLLDDPLSAVDTHVAKHIFQKCIIEHLKEKARILVTHQLQYLQNADRILILKDSKAIACGSYSELKEKGINFSSFVKEKKETEQKVPNRSDLMKSRSISWTPSIASTESEFSINAMAEGSLNSDHQIGLAMSNKELNFEMNTTKKEQELIKQKIEAPKMSEESRQSGSIKSETYWEYIKSSKSPFLAIVAFVSMIVSQIFLQSSDVWLTEWTKKQSNEDSLDTLDINQNDRDIFVLGYSILIGAMFVTAMIRTTSFFLICMRASINLHNTIFTRLLYAPISHFDKNPSGRILNRFSKDTGIVDENLPAVAYELQVTITTVLGIMAVNAYTNPYLIIPGVVLAIFVLVFRYYYIASARDIKRLEGVARSPVYSHINNTLTGLTTLRSFGVQNMFLDQFYSHQNVHSSAYFLIICTSRGFGVLMDWICLCYIATVVIFVMVFPGVFASYAGLALSSSLTLTGITQWGVRCSADLESYMTSVERMIEYTQLEREDSPKTLLTSRHQMLRVPSKEKWPKEGEICFENMTLYYDGAIKPVLKNISCTIEGGSKVGVVGRTGAGKSSLISALFRMCKRIEGSIKIDGIDTSQVLLAQLRKSISIIPQDPLIFTGTVRYNIDPFSHHTDERLWEVLEEVQLKNPIKQLPGGLSGQISEGGSNFSVGQRQLICLARAILGDNKILLLDEATANVDHRTDQLIQKTIRRRFAKCTVITVAHRLNTIIDSDKIIVLDAGNLVEFDSPYELLRVQDGYFAKLVEQTGKRMSKKLFHIAQEVYFGHQYNEDDVVEEEEEDEHQ